MELDVRPNANVDAATRQALAAALEAQRTLEDVVAWALAQTPPLVIEDVVIQDEYTHDVVLPYRGGLWLVYDAT